MSSIEVNVIFEKSIFKSEDGYQIIKCSDIDSDKEYILVGHFLPLQDSVPYVISGTLKDHAKYGEQIEVKTVEKYIISDSEKIVEYFSGGLFFGIGKVTAQNIVDELGNDAINKILEDETVLQSVKNLSERKAKKLYSKLKELNDTTNSFNLLLNAGFSQKISSKIYGDYGDDAKDILEDDPFIIYYENPYKYQIKTFYNVCDHFGIGKHDIRYISASIYEFINNHTFNNGDTYVMYKDLVNFESIDLALEYLINLKVVEVIDDKVMHKRMIDAENTVANFFNYNSTSKEDEMPFDFDSELDIFCKSKKISFATEQIAAIKNSFLNRVSVITGGPGTGKTTIISAICKIFINAYNLDLGENIFESELVLLAPTGRAAKRMNEQTQISASTIHRYLKWDIGSNSFEYNDTNKCRAKVVVVDEVSMIDTYLFANLIDALDSNAVVILIGDDMQLSSVGCGDILHDVIKSNKVSITNLTKVYRQDDDILVNFMHKIRNFEIPSDLTTKYPNRNFIMCDGDSVYGAISDIISKIKVKGLDIFDFQFLIPMYKGSVGIDNINKLCQNIFNPETSTSKQCEIGQNTFRSGDKIIITKNYPNDNVYNGDLGIIKNVYYKDKKLTISIDVDSRNVEFSGEDLFSISHGYAISIHKSQGSEFKHVIIPVTLSYAKMLRHDLIYTAITRAKDSLLIVGQESVFINSVCNRTIEKRKTNLLSLLDECQEISPFDFM